MKHLNILKIAATDVVAENVPQLMDTAGIEYHDIDCVDWADEYPYKPKVNFALAYTDKELLVHYRVEEQCIRAVAPGDNGHVWEDSCCEFFVQPVDDHTYYNIECNCAGTLLVGFGSGRDNRELASKTVLDGVKRWSSLGRKPFEAKDGCFKWQMALVIPFATFFKHQIETVDGKTIKGNFYKCGDKTSVPHFLSWNPIILPSPDFHRPDFFGEFSFR